MGKSRRESAYEVLLQHGASVSVLYARCLLRWPTCDSSLAQRLTSLPCRLAAAMVIVARPRTTWDSKNGRQRLFARNPFLRAVGGVDVEVELAQPVMRCS